MLIYSRCSPEWRSIRERNLMTTGVVALSFAKRSEQDEPGPVNKRLARAVTAIIDELNAGGEDVALVTQWEIAKQLTRDGEPVGFVVNEKFASTTSGNQRYLSSSDILEVAYDLFRMTDVHDVVVVANPFIHLQVARKMVKSAGFTIMKAKLPWVGFDPSKQNLQWWTKGPVRFVSYLAVQAIGAITRRTFNGIGERQPQP